jgi:protein-disulfide isomerase/uncharacterized membrane protein
MLLGLVSTYVRHEVASSNGAYASFCNLSATVNCDTVVTSRFAKLFGVPVSVWGVAFYALLFATAVRAMRARGEARDRARADSWGLAIAGAFFSLYLAGVSFLILKTVCVLCAGLYVVSAMTLAAAWFLARPPSASLALLRERWNSLRRRPVLATAAAAAVALVLALPAWLGAPTRMTRQEVFRTNPKFYDWYTQQPIVDDTPPDGGNVEGPDNAPITLIEFSDFQCPHCSRAHATLKDVLPRYHSEVRFIFHHFPLSSDCNDTMPNRGHEHACAAAVAAECAAQAGHFSVYANQLFAHQDALDPQALRGYAKELGIATPEFETCLKGTDAPARVRADVDAAKRAGVSSTPTFFINGRRIEGNMTFENWLMAFAVELDKS